MASQPLYYNNSDSSESDEIEDPPSKRQRKSHIWTKIKCFATGKEALDFVKAQKFWRNSGESYVIKGRRISYNCKLLWHGFPVLIAGCSDKNRTFHPVSIAVCTNEAEADFTFLFESLKENSNYTPKCLVSDCSDAISNACSAVFDENVIRIFCWAHVIRKTNGSSE
jgi:hypothetical protein